MQSNHTCNEMESGKAFSKSELYNLEHHSILQEESVSSTMCVSRGKRKCKLFYRRV